MMPPQWEPDIAIDAELATTVIAAAFPQFGRATVEPYGYGWDNSAFLVDGRTIFRFPRRRIAAPLIEHELAFLPAIGPLLPIAISAPTYAGAATRAYPHAFAGYDALPGVTACSRDLTLAQRATMATQLAAFLRALHAIDPAPLLANGLPADDIGRLDHDKRLEMSRARVELITASGTCDDVASFVDWLDAHPAVPIAPDARTFVHGDLYARHVLLDARATVCGIIDWGDLHFGDPAIDLSIAHMLLPRTAHAAFREAYGAIDERTWHVARYRAVYHAILELDYGLRENDEGMKRGGLAALSLLRDG